ncbi:hypothetical protein LR48_Vigan03g123200 [Vigna angularis]|uniref:Uncharacterized protein n=1 Tax=Phaseolus angularis TaxID=3914 RepID=A0A0L9U4Y3_PHAAN|nr:hypothetical protein LR48_Vigan03g123200 [Vigna angularis]
MEAASLFKNEQLLGPEVAAELENTDAVGGARKVFDELSGAVLECVGRGSSSDGLPRGKEARDKCAKKAQMKRNGPSKLLDILAMYMKLDKMCAGEAIHLATCSIRKKKLQLESKLMALLTPHPLPKMLPPWIKESEPRNTLQQNFTSALPNVGKMNDLEVAAWKPTGSGCQMMEAASLFKNEQLLGPEVAAELENADAVGGARKVFDELSGAVLEGVGRGSSSDSLPRGKEARDKGAKKAQMKRNVPSKLLDILAMYMKLYKKCAGEAIQLATCSIRFAFPIQKALPFFFSLPPFLPLAHQASLVDWL